MIPTKIKDPNAERAVTVNWATWLAALGTGTTIAQSTWAVSPNDGTLVVSGQGVGSTATSCHISGGTVGVTYRLTNHIVASVSPTEADDRSIFIRVEER